MSPTDLMPSALTFEASNRDRSPDATLRLLAGVVRELAHRIDTMWSEDPTNGSVALRLVEASHSLHRAAIALQEDVLIGQPLRS